MCNNKLLLITALNQNRFQPIRQLLPIRASYISNSVNFFHKLKPACECSYHQPKCRFYQRAFFKLLFSVPRTWHFMATTSERSITTMATNHMKSDLHVGKENAENLCFTHLWSSSISWICGNCLWIVTEVYLSCDKQFYKCICLSFCLF